MGIRLKALFLVVMALAPPGGSAAPSKCQPPDTREQALAESEVVIEATPVWFSWTDERTRLDCSENQCKNCVKNDCLVLFRIALLRVERVWKGDLGPYVVALRESEKCDWSLSPGSTAVIYSDMALGALLVSGARRVVSEALDGERARLGEGHPPRNTLIRGTRLNAEVQDSWIGTEKAQGETPPRRLAVHVPLDKKGRQIEPKHQPAWNWRQPSHNEVIHRLYALQAWSGERSLSPILPRSVVEASERLWEDFMASRSVGSSAVHSVIRDFTKAWQARLDHVVETELRQHEGSKWMNLILGGSHWEEF